MEAWHPQVVSGVPMAISPARTSAAFRVLHVLFKCLLFPSGVTFRFRMPGIRRKDIALEQRQDFSAVQLPPISLSIRRVLVLEDNFIIAMEAEDILKSLGIETVEIATNTQQAETLILESEFDFAMLDVNLGAENSFSFAEKLRSLDIPFGFVSGYGETAMFPVPLQQMPRITKPFNEASVNSLLLTAVITPSA